jgi:hypothetical protein
LPKEALWRAPMAIARPYYAYIKETCMQTSFLLLLLAALLAGCTRHVTFAATRERPEAGDHYRARQNSHASPVGEDLQGHLSVWGWQHGML